MSHHCDNLFRLAKMNCLWTGLRLITNQKHSLLRSLCSITSFKRLWLAEHWQVTYSYRKIGHNYVIWKIDENWSVRPRNSHRIGVSESVRAKMQTHRAFVDGKSSSRQAGWHLIEPSVATTLTSHRTKPTQASQAREHASKSGLSTISHLCIPWIIRESNQIPCVIILYPDSCQHIAACNGAAASTPFTSPRESCCKASFAAGVLATTAYKAAETAQRFLPTTLLQTLARLLTKFCGSGLTISILLEER